MANESIALFEGAEFKDRLRDVVLEALTELMELEVRSLTGAGHGERSEDRLVSRNGYRERTLRSRVGDLPLRIPKLRRGSYFPSFLEPRRTVEKALVSVIQEAYLQGVSTRAVDDLVKALGGSGVSKSEVSRLCAEVEVRVREFLDRPLEGVFPYVWLDATYVKVREGSRIVSKAAVMAVGLNEEGRREVLGMRLGHAETESFWTEFLRSLLDRGLRGVRLATSDSHAGLVKAIQRCAGCQWQRCRVHFMRNVLARVPQGRKELVASFVRTAMAQTTPEDTSASWDEVATMLENPFPEVARLVREAKDDVLAHRSHPRELWPVLASTNGLERLNREVKRRADVVQIFPNENSVVRLVGAILMEQHDEWQVTRRQTARHSLGLPSTQHDALLARAAGW
ncbi:MAG: IS256 family transposase [Fimbriimonadaceae bacterium]|nr:IS256 family transposase [Fimbriimonadaceae bacterium]